MEIRIRGNNFQLLSEKAVWWQEKKTLLISDMHLGKVSHFRKEGFAIPSNLIAENFNRLDFLLKNYFPERIIFLGDLFHHRINIEWDLFTEWRNKNSSVEMNIVLGNHDIIPEKEFIRHGVTPFCNDLIEEDFRFSHFPEEQQVKNYFSFCGHVHPVFRLEISKQSLRLPCFVYKNYQMILPSFGAFTGGYTMPASEGEIFFLIAAKEVFQFKP